MAENKEIKGINEAVLKILASVNNKEKIIIFGDGDLDGVSSAVILEEALEILGNPASFIFFANREKYGYGLSEDVLKVIQSRAPALLIILDCGTCNLKGAELAAKMGFEVIIVDHHQPLETLPEKALIVNPKQPGDGYSFKELCAAGLSYKLVKALIFASGKPFFPEQFLELAALATLYDQVPLKEDNEQIVNQALFSFPQTKRIGLKILYELMDCRIFDRPEIQGKIIPTLSAAGYRDYKNEAFPFLLEKRSRQKVKKMALELMEKSRRKKERISEIMIEIGEKRDLSQVIIFEGSKDWPLSLLGTISSKLCEYYRKPAFIYHQGEDESQGSVRVPSEMDSIMMMAPCDKILLNYGGHPRASGFGLKNENLEKFKKCLIDNYQLVF